MSDNKRRDIAHRLAPLMHERYEAAAEHYGWETQATTKVSFDALPEANKQTMLATAGAVVDYFGPLIEAAECAKGFLHVAALAPSEPFKPAGEYIYHAVKLDEALRSLLDGDRQRRN
jgi:hypothetical protein